MTHEMCFKYDKFDFFAFIFLRTLASKKVVTYISEIRIAYAAIISTKAPTLKIRDSPLTPRMERVPPYPLQQTAKTVLN